MTGFGGEKSLLDDFDDNNFNVPLDDEGDDIEVTFVDEPEKPVATSRRGQNEELAEADDQGEAVDGDIDSPKIRERIQRERRLRMDLERRADAEREASDRAIYEAKRETLRVQRDAFRAGIDGLDANIRTVREALKMARQEGDVSAETDIEGQLRHLERLRSDTESQQARLPSDEAFDRAYAEHRAQVMASRRQQRSSADTDDGAAPQNDLARRWKTQNAWMDDPNHEIERDADAKLSNKLAAEGYAADDPEHFKELSKAIAKKFPSLAVKDSSGRQLSGATNASSPQRRPAIPPVQGGRNQAQGDSRQVREVKLNNDDIRMMKAMRLDPTNERVRKYWAREKLATARREAQNRGR